MSAHVHECRYDQERKAYLAPAPPGCAAPEKHTARWCCSNPAGCYYCSPEIAKAVGEAKLAAEAGREPPRRYTDAQQRLRRLCRPARPGKVAR